MCTESPEAELVQSMDNKLPAGKETHLELEWVYLGGERCGDFAADLRTQESLEINASALGPRAAQVSHQRLERLLQFLSLEHVDWGSSKSAHILCKLTGML